MQSVKQEPIYLPDVENNPQPSRYLNLIQTCQNTGRETWNIWYLFAFRPEMTEHLARFTQEVMREPSPLSPGLRASIPEADVKGLRALGWHQESIYYTITVCALFNFYNRWITASGAHAVSDEGHRLHGKVLAHKGYDPQLRERHLGGMGGSSK
jgi:hypothetical protein